MDSWNQVWDILSQIEAIRSQFCPWSQFQTKPHVWDWWVSLVKFHKKLRLWTVGINFWKFYSVNFILEVEFGWNLVLDCWVSLVIFPKNWVCDSWNQVWDILSQMEAIESQFCPWSQIWTKPHVWDCSVSLAKFHKKLRLWTVGINFWKFYPVNLILEVEFGWNLVLDCWVSLVIFPKNWVCGQLESSLGHCPKWRPYGPNFVLEVKFGPNLMYGIAGCP